MKRILSNPYLLAFVLLVPALLSFTNDETTNETVSKSLTNSLEVPERGELTNAIKRTESHADIVSSFNVTITMYEPVASQTDDTPNITADGTKFDILVASEYKYVALSRNLLKRWGGVFDYGDFILIKGADGKSGKYQVRDTMNPRFVNYVDILESPGTGPYKYENATIIKYNPSNTKQPITLIEL